MNEPIAVTDTVFWIGVNDRETHLFEALWPLPQGISYKAYLIHDRKTALVDAVKQTFLNDLVEPVVETRCAPSDNSLGECVKLGTNLAKQIQEPALIQS